MKSQVVTIGAGTLMAMSLIACGSTATQVVAVQKGAVPLDQVHIGVPTTVFKEAICSFVPDPNGSFAGKVQYLSRITDENGGQYVVQTKGTQCFQIDVVHKSRLIDKKTALKTMERLLPIEVAKLTPQISNSNSGGQIMEEYSYGKDYRGQLFYSGNSARQVKLISVSRLGAL